MFVGRIDIKKGHTDRYKIKNMMYYDGVKILENTRKNKEDDNENIQKSISAYSGNAYGSSALCDGIG